MKKNILAILCLLYMVTSIEAAGSKTIDIPIAGTLSSSLSTNSKSNVTTLVITGNIDSRDIKCMRDEMPALVSIDLRNAFIKSYTGIDGTINTSAIYAENEMPAFSFNTASHIGKAITSIYLPSSITSIGTSAFEGCSLLSEISIPSFVNTIQSGAFVACTNLSSLICKSSIPPTLEANVFSVDNLAQKFSATLFFPVGAAAAYSTAQTDWLNFFKSYAYILTTSTQTASAVDTNSALLKGSLDVIIDSPVSANGFCWNTAGSPTINDNIIDNGAKTTLGIISNTISNLAQNTKYYARAYATDGSGTVYGNEISFTTEALPQAAGLIVGNTTVCQGQVTVTYTVPLIPFATSYTWGLPTGISCINNNSSSNSITVNIANSFTTGSLSVKGHNSWGDGELSSLTITANLLPDNAGAIIGNSSICLGDSSVTYTVPTIANSSSYIWTLPTGATGSSVTNSIKLSFGVRAVSGSITVKGRNDCGDGASSTLAVAINKYPLVELINKTTKSGIPFQLNPSVSYAGLDSLTYQWSPSLGLDNPNILNPTATLTQATTYTLRVTSSKGCSASAQMTVLLIPDDAGTILGNSAICLSPNTLTETFTVPIISGASSYVWTLPIGAKASTIPMSTSNSITVNFQKATFIGGNITVKGNNSVGFGTVSTLPITMNNIPTVSLTALTVKAGASVQLTPSISYSGTGVLNYRWTPSKGLNDSTIVNPIATLKQEVSTYTLTVTNSSGCSTSDQITISTLPANAGAITGKSSVCPGSSETYTVAEIPGATSYSWTIPKGAAGFSTTNSITVDFSSTGYSGNISVKGVNGVGNGTATTFPVLLNKIPLITMVNKTVKSGGSVQLSPAVNYTGNGTMSFAWSPGKGLSDSTIMNPTAILTKATTYTLTVNVSTGCSTSAEITVGIIPMSKPELGIVGVSNNKNVLVWNKELSIGIDAYNIYKESSIINQFDKIGTVAYDSLSVFVDTQSNTTVHSDRYQISILDKSGMESVKSTTHKSMYLTVNSGNGTAPSISWEPYGGFAIANYNIYRGTTPNNLKLLGTTDLNTPNYYDASAPAGNLYYQVEVISPINIMPTKLINGISQNGLLTGIDNFSASRSNIVAVTNMTNGLKENDAINFELFPNPCKGVMTIRFEKGNSLNYSLSIINALGQKVHNEKIVSDKTILDISQFGNKGIYFVQILDEKGVVIGRKKIIVQ